MTIKYHKICTRIHTVKIQKVDAKKISKSRRMTQVPEATRKTIATDQRNHKKEAETIHIPLVCWPPQRFLSCASHPWRKRNFYANILEVELSNATATRHQTRMQWSKRRCGVITALSPCMRWLLSMQGLAMKPRLPKGCTSRGRRARTKARHHVVLNGTH